MSDRTWFKALVGLLSVVALAAAATLSAALFTGWFQKNAAITMKVDRAGLLTAPGSDVKFHGVVVGRVTKLTYEGGEAVISMAINPRQLSAIPDTVTARVTPSTLFGRKSIDLIPDGDRVKFVPLADGAVIDRTGSAIEVNDLFSDLLAVLDAIDADKVKDTLYAVSTGLTGRGRQLGEMLVTLDRYLREFNGSLPTLERDIGKFARTMQTFADASPAVLDILGDLPTIQKLLTDNRSQLGVFLLSFTRFGNTGNTLLTQSQGQLRGATDGLAPVVGVLAEYSPVYPCFFASLDHNRRVLERAMGGARTGLNAQGALLAGDPPYRYPQNLPKVAAANAPSCYGSTPQGTTIGMPGHVDFNDGSGAYRDGLTLTGRDLAAFLFGVRK